MEWLVIVVRKLGEVDGEGVGNVLMADSSTNCGSFRNHVRTGGLVVYV